MSNKKKEKKNDCDREIPCRYLKCNVAIKPLKDFFSFFDGFSVSYG